MGPAEIAEYLGLKRARVKQLAAMPDFPRPYQEVAATRLWRESDIRRWAIEHGRVVEDEAEGE